MAGIAHSHLHNFPQAEQSLKAAAVFCSGEDHAGCGDLLQARGLLLSEQGQSSAAMQFYRQSLQFARSRGDRFLESSSLLNIGDEELSLGHFDEAIHQSRAAHGAARTVGAVVIELVTQDNIAWAYYKLGDSERALEELVEAEETAGRFGDFSDQENELTNIGYIYMDQHKFDLASQSFQRALQIANDIKAKQDTYNTLRVLARLALPPLVRFLGTACRGPCSKQGTGTVDGR